MVFHLYKSICYTEHISSQLLYIVFNYGTSRVPQLTTPLKPEENATKSCSIDYRCIPHLSNLGHQGNCRANTITNFIRTITPEILDRFRQSKWPLKALKKTFQTVSKMSQSNQYSADQLVITKSPDTKSPISWELLNIIVCFNDHHKALFNALLLAINKT